MNVRINQAEKLKKEIRRKNWIKRVKKQRKRYLSRALKGSSMRKFTWQKQAFSEMLSFFLWVWLGVLMLAVSWVLFLRMGTASFEIFGVEVRVQDGRIVFFQERKGRVLEGE